MQSPDPDSDRLFDLAWGDFEALVTEFLRQTGWSVTRSQPTRDGGIDMRVSKGTQRGVVQCKRWQKPVSVTVVRDLLGAAKAEGADEIMLVFTSRLTRPASLLARKTGVQILGRSQFWDQISSLGLTEMVDRLADPVGPAAIPQALEHFLEDRGSGQRPKSLLIHGPPPRSRSYRALGRFMASALRCRLAYLRETSPHSYSDDRLVRFRDGTNEFCFDERLRRCLRRAVRHVLYTPRRERLPRGAETPPIRHPDIFLLGDAPLGTGFVPHDPQTWQFDCRLLIFVDGLERLSEGSLARFVEALTDGQWRAGAESPKTIPIAEHVVVASVACEDTVQRLGEAFQHSLRSDEIPWRVIARGPHAGGRAVNQRAR